MVLSSVLLLLKERNWPILMTRALLKVFQSFVYPFMDLYLVHAVGSYQDKVFYDKDISYVLGEGSEVSIVFVLFLFNVILKVLLLTFFC